MREFLAISMGFCLVSLVPKAHAGLDSGAFQTPPKSTQLHTWWHWMDGNISRDGITKDLESMHRQGIVQATIINIGKNYPREVDGPKTKFGSPEWIEMFQWSLTEASRLGITIGTQTIDGYGTTGGPWITPEMSMKQYVWGATNIQGGKAVDITLPKPLVVENFYRDVAVIAYPSAAKQSDFHKIIESINVNGAAVGSILYDGNPKTSVKLRKGDVIDFSFKHEFEADQLALLPHLIFCWDDMAKVFVKFTLSSSNDGKEYVKLAEIGLTGVNQSISTPYTSSPSRFYRLEFAENNFKFFDDYPLAEVEFLKGGEKPLFSPRIASFFEKTASVFDTGEKVFETSSTSEETNIDEKSIIDLTEFVSADGVLKWAAPAGQWKVIRFGYTSTGLKNDPPTNEGRGLEADKMDSAAIDLHINSHAKKLVEAAGKHKGSTLKFFLMDSWEAQFQTWSTTFPEEFKKRRGYSILPWIPVLCGETVGSITLSEAFLHDFRETISDLIDQHYYKRFSELCDENGMEMHAEAIYNNWGGYPPFEPLKAHEYIDFPMTEFWAEQDENHFSTYKPEDRPKPGFPTSAALAHDKQLIGSEAYTSFAHYTETPFDLKPFGDASYCSGVNQLILHSFVHQPFDKKPGMTLGKFGAHFNRNNPWWEFTQDWLTYQSRIQYVLQKGYPVVDVLFYGGDELSQNFSRSFLKDLPFGFQASACNFEMLEKKAKVIDGRISLGRKQTYPLLMLPNSSKMEFSTLQQIAELVEAGAAVYGPKPLQMLSMSEIENHSTEFKKLVDQLWGDSNLNRYGKGMMLSGMPIGEALKQLELIPDLTTNHGDPKEVMYIHRKVEDLDIYFVFNQQNKTLNREILFRVSGKAPEIWDPANGSIFVPAIYSVEGSQTRIPISLKPFESKIVVFKNQGSDASIRKVTLAGQQVFPLPQGGDGNHLVPRATHRNGKLEFVGDVTGKYSFETNAGRLIELELVAPKSFALRDTKTKIDFFSIAQETIPSIEVNELKALTDFDDPAIKYFAGKAKYSMEFSVPEDFTTSSDATALNLGSLSATAEVRLNGTLLGFAWTPNTEFNVQHLLQKTNKLEVTVATVCRNRFIGDLRETGVISSLWTTSPIETILTKEMPLKPSGLIGPVKLIGRKNHHE